MAEKHAFATLTRASRGDAVVLASTFLLTVFRDLTEGILAGFGLSTLLFLHRMAHAVEIAGARPQVERDKADFDQDRTPYDVTLATDHDVVVLRISGAFFFGAAASVAAALDRIAEHPRAYVIDFAAVPVLDSSAAATIEGLVRKARAEGVTLYVSGARSAIRRTLLAHGVRPPLVRFKSDVRDAVASAHAALDAASGRAGTAADAVLQAD